MADSFKMARVRRTTGITSPNILELEVCDTVVKEPRRPALTRALSTVHAVSWFKKSLSNSRSRSSSGTGDICNNIIIINN